MSHQTTSDLANPPCPPTPHVAVTGKSHLHGVPLGSVFELPGAVTAIVTRKE